MYQVMIVDDEPLVIKGISYIIENNFDKITVGAQLGNGERAVEYARKNEPDVIFMDIKLEGLNGLEVISEINKFLDEVIIVVISAYDNFNYAQKAIKLGVMDYLLKPVNKQDIIQILRKAVMKLKVKKSTVHFQQLKKKTEYNFNPPWEKERDLFKAVELLYKEQAFVKLDEIFMHLNNKGKGELEFLKHYSQELLAVILRLIYEYLTEEKNEMFDLEEIYNAIIVANSVEELISVLKNKIGKIIDSISPENREEINPVLVKAKKYMDNNFEKNLSLEQIADQVAISPNYLSKLFKDKFQVTIIDYLTEKRIEQAKKLLRNTGSSVKKIAGQVGYNDANYFSRVFKKKAGQAPTQFREDS